MKVSAYWSWSAVTAALHMVVLSFPMPCSGADDIFDRFEGRVRLGMEVELTPRQYEQFVRYFDFSDFQRRHPLGEARLNGSQAMALAEIADEYLGDPLNFDSLPDTWKARLTEGIEGGFRVQLEPVKPLEAGSPPGRLVLREQKLEAGATIDTGKPREVVKAETDETRRARGHLRLDQEGERGLVLPSGTRERQNWQKIVDRWKSIPSYERFLEVLQLERLTARQKSRLVFLRIVKPEDLSLKSGLPIKIQDALRGLSWKAEGVNDVVSHIEVVNDPSVEQRSARKFISQVREFASLGGFWDAMKEPLKAMSRTGARDLTTSYHFHLSLPDSNLEKVAVLENLSRFVRGVEKDLPVLEGRHVIFNQVTERGLVRLVAQNRVEMRAQYDDPEIELRGLLRKIENTQAFEEELDGLLTEERMRRLLQRLLASAQSRDASSFSENWQTLVRNSPRFKFKNKSPRLKAILGMLEHPDPDLRLRAQGLIDRVIPAEVFEADAWAAVQDKLADRFRRADIHEKMRMMSASTWKSGSAFEKAVHVAAVQDLTLRRQGFRRLVSANPSYKAAGITFALLSGDERAIVAEAAKANDPLSWKWFWNAVKSGGVWAYLRAIAEAEYGMSRATRGVMSDAIMGALAPSPGDAMARNRLEEALTSLDPASKFRVSVLRDPEAVQRLLDSVVARYSLRPEAAELELFTVILKRNTSQRLIDARACLDHADASVRRLAWYAVQAESPESANFARLWEGLHDPIREIREKSAHALLRLLRDSMDRAATLEVLLPSIQGGQMRLISALGSNEAAVRKAASQLLLALPKLEVRETQAALLQSVFTEGTDVELNRLVRILNPELLDPRQKQLLEQVTERHPVFGRVLHETQEKIGVLIGRTSSCLGDRLIHELAD